MKSYFFWVLSGVQNLFGVSYKQAKGILILQGLILLLIICPILLSIYFPKPSIERSLDDEKLLNELIARWDQGKEFMKADQSSFASNHNEPVYFPFDPNSISYDKMVEIGFPTWLAERLISYRNAGGKFAVKSDIKKVYGLQDWLYNQIEDYIQLPDKLLVKVTEDTNADKPFAENVESTKESNPISKELDSNLPLLLDINLADSVDLQKIRGIGPAFSSRIVRYRNILGGFVSIDQLNEVYGLSEETFEAMKPFIILNEKFNPIKIPVNKASQDELSSHPYINFNTARALVNYRSQHGSFKSLDELKFVKVLSDSMINKIAPYLDFSSNEYP